MFHLSQGCYLWSRCLLAPAFKPRLEAKVQHIKAVVNDTPMDLHLHPLPAFWYGKSAVFKTNDRRLFLFGEEGVFLLQAVDSFVYQ